MSKKGDLYQRLYQAHVRADPQSAKESLQKKTVEEWNAAKKDFAKESDFYDHIKKLIEKLDQKATQ